MMRWLAALTLAMFALAACASPTPTVAPTATPLCDGGETAVGA